MWSSGCSVRPTPSERRSSWNMSGQAVSSQLPESRSHMPPSIETNRLLLRPFTPDDAEALHTQIFGDPDAMEFLPGGIPRTLKQTERVIEYYTDAWKQYG